MTTQKNSTNKKENFVLGIDIGSAFLRACISEISEYPTPTLFVQEESEGVSHGVIIDEKKFTNSLEKLILKISKKIKVFPNNVIVSIGGIGLNSATGIGSVFTSRADGLISIIDIEKLEGVIETKIVELKNKNILHKISIKNYIDGKEVMGTVEGMRGHKIESKYIFIYDDIKQKDIIISAFKNFNIDIQNMVAGPLADSIVSLSHRERNIGAVSINIGSETTSVLVYENSAPLLSTVINMGSESLTSDIALGLRVDIAEAEKIKKGESDKDFLKRRYDEIVEARISFLSEKINEELARVKRAELLPSGAVLSGAGAKLAKIEYYMRFEMKVPINNALKNINKDKFYVEELDFVRAYGTCFFADETSESKIILDTIKKYSLRFGGFIKKFLP
jgi:cell division protein FtsA